MTKSTFSSDHNIVKYSQTLSVFPIINNEIMAKNRVVLIVYVNMHNVIQKYISAINHVILLSILVKFNRNSLAMNILKNYPDSMPGYWDIYFILFLCNKTKFIFCRIIRKKFNLEYSTDFCIKNYYFKIMTNKKWISLIYFLQEDIPSAYLCSSQNLISSRNDVVHSFWFFAVYFLSVLAPKCHRSSHCFSGPFIKHLKSKMK